MNKDDFKLGMALKLYSEARVEESERISWEVYKSTTDAFTKLQAVNFLTCSMNKVEHNKELVKLCDEGMELSEQLGRQDIRAIYMASKAECLIHRCMALHYKMRSFNISPGWKDFALESDRLEHNKLSSKKSNYEREVNVLLAGALEIAENAPDRMILVRVLRSQAFVYGIYRLMFVTSGERGYSGLFLFFLNNFRVQLISLQKNRKEIKEAENKCRDVLLRAVSITKSTGNEQECTYVLFSLTSEMNVFGRKRGAKKYLREAEKLAYKLGEKILIRQVLLLKKAVNEKIPKEYSKPPKFTETDY